MSIAMPNRPIKALKNHLFPIVILIIAAVLQALGEHAIAQLRYERQAIFDGEVTKFSTVSLPMAAWTEADGTCTSSLAGDRSITTVVPPQGEARGLRDLLEAISRESGVALPPGGAPRDVINKYKSEMALVPVETDSVLQDVDTPEDYKRARWQAGLDKS